jgi:hypothetical protein
MQSNLDAVEMLEMRALAAVILLALGIASVNAADLPTEQGEGYSTRSIGLGDRTGVQVVYDFEPGINVRPYWLAPWRHRHYYPATGEKPEIGRDEDLSAPSGDLEPAETFRRHWSTSSVVVPRLSRVRQRLDEEPSQNPAPLK